MNSNFLTSGKVGNIGLNHMKQVRENTINKWDSLGFLDGLKGHVKENIAQLYENEASHLLNESTDASSSGSFETVVFPIVRRVFSKLLANDIVSVQAMNMPIGKLFFFVPQTSARYDAAGDAYGDPHKNGPQYSAHTSMGADGLPIVRGVDPSYAPTKYLAKNLYDIYYNDGLFDASKGTISIIAGTGNLVTLSADGTFAAAADFSELPTSTDGSLRTAIFQVSGFSAINKGRLSGPDGNPMDTESFLASLKVVTNGITLEDADSKTIKEDATIVPFRLVTQKYGRGIVDYNDVCDAAGVIYLELDMTHPVDADGTSTYDGYVGVDVSGAQSAYTSADFSVSWAEYATLELETEMGEVSFKLDEVVVSVEERKLRATWSPELAQDVSAFHNIDAEAELTAMLSEQVAAEIDREILRDIRSAAAWQLRWDWNGWRKASLAANAYTQKDWNQTLITKVNQISAQIHKSTLRGGANFIVVSSEISAVFDDLEYFHVSDASPEQDQYNMGIEKIGSLSGRYQVYRDPYAPSWSLIMGHKGKSLLDTGYIYAPYVPMQLTPTMYNPFNFAPVKGIMTRYAKKVVNNRFYGAVRVDGLQTFNANELR
jgi:hypothetical protein